MKDSLVIRQRERESCFSRTTLSLLALLSACVTDASDFPPLSFPILFFPSNTILSNPSVSVHPFLSPFSSVSFLPSSLPPFFHLPTTANDAWPTEYPLCWHLSESFLSLSPSLFSFSLPLSPSLFSVSLSLSLSLSSVFSTWFHSDENNPRFISYILREGMFHDFDSWVLLNVFCRHRVLDPNELFCVCVPHSHSVAQKLRNWRLFKGTCSWVDCNWKSREERTSVSQRGREREREYKGRRGRESCWSIHHKSWQIFPFDLHLSLFHPLVTQSMITSFLQWYIHPHTQHSQLVRPRNTSSLSLSPLFLFSIISWLPILKTKIILLPSKQTCLKSWCVFVIILSHF